MSEQKEQRVKRGRFGKWTIARRIVQVLILLLFLAPIVAAGWSVAGLDTFAPTNGDSKVTTPAEMPFYGTLSSSFVGPVLLLDPFGVLQVIAASKTFEAAWLVGLLPVLLVFGLIRGRSFCGWVCPVNFVLEGIDWLRKKLFKKQQLPERVLPRHAKLWVALGVLVLSAIVSVPVFEVLSPISFINKGLVFGSLVGGFTLFAIILVELFWGHRVWCRALCPLGGFYEAVGKVGLVNVRIDHDTCINCKKCQKACLCDPEILDRAIAGETDAVCAGDCMVCGKCIDVCPTGSLSMGLLRGKGGYSLKPEPKLGEAAKQAGAEGAETAEEVVAQAS